MQSALGNPVPRFLLAAVAAAVVVADGIVLVGYTNTIPGSAVPVRVPVTAQTQVSTAPTSSAAPPAPPPAAKPTTARPQPNVKSPFAERCRTGQIPAWLCRGLPG